MLPGARSIAHSCRAGSGGLNEDAGWFGVHRIARHRDRGIVGVAAGRHVPAPRVPRTAHQPPVQIPLAQRAAPVGTGVVERVVTGLWPGGKEVTQHPDTQQTLLGQTLPDWRPAMDLCLSAAAHFPGWKLQHWDGAFCAQGPVLMELNTEADLGVPQLLGRRPIIDQTIKIMMANA